MLLIGFFLLVLGADILIEGSSNIAKSFKIPEILIGLTVVALGTSLPELMVTICSANTNASDLTVGNAIGSNLCNLLLILGIVSIIKPVEIDKNTKLIYLPIALISTLAILILTMGIVDNARNVLNRLDGIILLILYFIYFLYTIIVESKDIAKAIKEDKNKKINLKSTFIPILYIITGITLLKIGGDLVVEKSVEIATKYGISERVIGLTIVAIGTALPELITSIVAIVKDDDDLAVGNLVGSCILNILLILGIGAVITPLGFSTSFISNTILLCFSIILIDVFCFIGKKNTITKYKGVTLLMIFLIYMFSLFK